MDWEKYLRNEFKALISNIKTLRGAERVNCLRCNIICQHIINYSHSDEIFLIAAVQNLDDETNVEILEILRENGADINYKDSNDNTLLYYAIDFSCKNLLTIKYLLEYVDDISPLYVQKNITDANFIDLVELYVEKGFDINCYDGLLLRRVYEYNKHLIQPLIKLGANIDCVDSHGSTILMTLLEKKIKIHLYMSIIDEMKLLIEAGANINHTNNNRSIVMLLVQLKNSYEIKYVEEVLKTKKIENINLVDSDGNSALKYAVKNTQDNAEILRLLLEKGADTKRITLEDVHDNIDFLTNYPSFTKYKLLVEYGWNMPNTNNLYERILMKNVKLIGRENLDIIKSLLLRDDIDINIIFGKYGEYENQTLLYQAVLHNNIKALKLLLTYGADYLAKCNVDVTWGRCEQRTFLANLNLDKHKEIYELIQEIEFVKRYMKKIIFPSLKTIYTEFTLSPSSIHSKTMAIKWDLGQMPKDVVYAKYKDDLLMAYYGINNSEILEIKILDQLKN